MEQHARENTVSQASTNTLATKIASITDSLRLVVESLQSTPERHGPIRHFLVPPEKRSLLHDNEVWVDDDEECSICKEPLVNQPEPCMGDPPPGRDDQPRACYPISLWPCDHIVGGQCFKLWMSDSVNSGAGLCPYCWQPLLVAPEPQSVMEQVQKKIKRYLSSSQMSAVPDQLVTDIHALQVQITTQPLNALQNRELRGPLQNLALMLYWCGRAFGRPLATIFSDLP